MKPPDSQFPTLEDIGPDLEHESGFFELPLEEPISRHANTVDDPLQEHDYFHAHPELQNDSCFDSASKEALDENENIHFSNSDISYNDVDIFSDEDDNPQKQSEKKSKLEVGMILESVEEAKQLAKEHGDEFFATLVVGRNDKNTLMLECKNSRFRKSKSAGERIRQHYNHTGCKARVRFSKRSDGSVKCTQINNHHNHPLSKVAFSLYNTKLTVEEEDAVSLLVDANVKTGQIKRTLEEKYGKILPTQKVKNLIAQSGGSEESEDLMNFLHKLQDDGGTYDLRVDENNEVSAIYISSASMIEAYESAGVDLFQVDTTFDIERSHYRVVGVCYLDPHTNATAVAAIGLIDAESSYNFKFVFESLKSMIKKERVLFVVDKDFTEINAILSIFPLARILLCWFHVIKYLKYPIISSALIHVEKKQGLLDSFKKVLMSRSEREYEERKTQLLADAEGVEVFPPGNQVAVPLTDYLLRNWLQCPEMWVKFHRRGLATLGDNTNNRIERMFRTMKQGVKEKFRSSPTAMQAVLFLLGQIDRSYREKRVTLEAKRLRIFNKDAEISSLNLEASSVLNERGCILWNKIQEDANRLAHKGSLDVVVGEGVRELFSDGSSKTYKTDETSCDCTYYLTNQAMCRHTLLLRRVTGLPAFDPVCFNDRWLRCEKESSPEDFSEEQTINDNGIQDKEMSTTQSSCVAEADLQQEQQDSDEEEKTEEGLDSHVKFNRVKPVMQRIIDLMVAHGTRVFNNYLGELKIVEEKITSGEPIFKQEASQTSNPVDSSASVKFKKKLKTVGRPKSSVHPCSFIKRKGDRPRIGVRPNNFVIPKKANEEQARKESVIQESSTVENIAPASSNDKIVCTFPPNKSKKNAVYIQDYLTLAPRLFIVDVIIDLKLRHLQPVGPSGAQVWLLASQLGQLLAQNWWSSPSLSQEVEKARPWLKGGCRIVALPWCERSHWFLLVAVLDPQPVLYSLESLGGVKPPAGAEILIKFLAERKLAAGGSSVTFQTLTPCVPRQPVGSNDCAIFTLLMAEQILLNPDDFIKRAADNKLSDWFLPLDSQHKREEIATWIHLMGEEQRQPGGVLEAEGPLNLPYLGFGVKTKRKCGYCKSTGHNRLTCPSRIKSEHDTSHDTTPNQDGDVKSLNKSCVRDEVLEDFGDLDDSLKIVW